MADYYLLDQPHLLQLLFYPRRDHTPPPPGSFDYGVNTGDDALIICRFYLHRPGWPWFIYFHGNGEVASDYDSIAPFYHHASFNLVVADYRGYGSSSGSPSFAHLIDDAHLIFKALRDKILTIDPSPDLFLMGRSLGSISVLELCDNYQDLIKGLIIESGFASATRLIKRFEIPVPGVDLDALEASCIESIARINCPTLIIHGARDSLVPLEEGELLYQTISSKEKNFTVIPFADHNDIMFADPKLYFGSITKFVFGYAHPQDLDGKEDVYE